jgi:nucleotide-binding universal stress UspA family protein
MANENLNTAINDFYEARNKAAIQEILSRFKGGSDKLLSFEEVRQKLKIQGSSVRGLQDIPLDAIIGSVGRYTDFTRDFLPRSEVSPDRWARVKMATTSLTGLPPIDVYKIGDAYFVQDGNHRVSVARQLGAPTIQAYVTEVRTRVPLTADTTPDELILKAEYAEFLEQTHLDELRPEADLNVTIPGQYPKLIEHIAVHQYFMGIDLKREVDYLEAVAHWYDTVYLPITEIICDRGIMRSFPDRTETDLYLWLTEHRAALEKQLGWKIDPVDAASDLVESFQPKPMIARLGERLLDATALDRFEAGPPVGQWRKKRGQERQEGRLFSDILVPVSGHPGGWNAVEQAILVARLENAQIHGLHVVHSAELQASEAAQAVQVEFIQRCERAGIPGNITVTVGDTSRQICRLSRWVDLIVVNLAYPPGPQPLGRLASGFQEIIQRCPRPVLATPQTFGPMTHALLAYDGSPKGKEALYVATYIAAKWELRLTVVTVIDDNRVTAATSLEAQDYLKDYQVQASFILESGPVAGTIIKVSKQMGCDLLVMGGYGYNPVLEVVLGSAVDTVLHECHKPMLICR